MHSRLLLCLVTMVQVRRLMDTMPCRQILKLYKDLGGKIITIGSDGHSTRYVGDHYEDAVRILKDIGFTQFTGFTKMKPEFHDL